MCSLSVHMGYILSMYPNCNDKVSINTTLAELFKCKLVLV